MNSFHKLKVKSGLDGFRSEMKTGLDAIKSEMKNGLDALNLEVKNISKLVAERKTSSFRISNESSKLTNQS